MKKLLLLVIGLVFLNGCGTSPSSEAVPENLVRSQPETIDGRLAFNDFDSFANYWADLLEKDEASLNEVEKLNGYTSQRSAIKTLGQEDAAASTFDDPYLQTVLNEQGLVQIADRVFLVTENDVISVASDAFPNVDLDALALSSTGTLQTQNTQGLDIAYSPIEWTSDDLNADSAVETQGIVSKAVWTFVKKYILPQASGTVDTCKSTYWKGSTFNKRRRVVGVSGAAKLTWINLSGNPTVLGVYAGTGNANVIYLPKTGTIHLNQSKNLKVTGNPSREFSSRKGTYRVSGKTARALGRVTYWAAGRNISVSGAVSTTHTASSKGKAGSCQTYVNVNLR